MLLVILDKIFFLGSIISVPFYFSPFGVPSVNLYPAYFDISWAPTHNPTNKEPHAAIVAPTVLTNPAPKQLITFIPLETANPVWTPAAVAASVVISFNTLLFLT